MILCNDYLLGAHYESVILAAHEPGIGAGFLHEPSKKDPIPTAAKMARRGWRYVPLIRIHKRFEYNHTFPKREWGGLEDYTKKMNAFALQFPAIGFFYSPTCENNFNRSDSMELMLMCSRHVTAPNLQLVNTIHKGATLPGIVDEVHGWNVKAPDGEFWFKSADGIGGKRIGTNPDGSPRYESRWPDGDIPDWMDEGPNCAAIFGWGFRFNLKYGPKEKAPPVDSRKIRPSPEYIKAYTRPLHPIGGKQQPRNGLIWKAIADDHGGGTNTKDNKAMCIVPDKHSEIVVKAANGREVAKLRYFGTYSEGGHRYYGDWAYKIAAKAKKLSGSEFCTIHGGRQSYGRLNPAFRGKPR